jgi:hypothetical protein
VFFFLELRPPEVKFEQDAALLMKPLLIKKELVKEEYKTLHKLDNIVKKDDLPLRTAKVRLPPSINSMQLLATDTMKQLTTCSDLSCLDHVVYLSDRDPSALKDATNQVKECILHLLPSQAERLHMAYQFELDALQPAWEYQRDVPVYNKMYHAWIMCIKIDRPIRGLQKKLNRKANCSVQVLEDDRYLLMQGVKQQDVHSLYRYYQRLHGKAAGDWNRGT